jgi:alpha,alpha-trehalose phosphorylase
VIAQDEFPVEPWAIRETRLELQLIAQSESVFALSNGHIGLRGNLDEGEPHGLPGSYLNSFFELRPLPYAESSYGNPESSQSIINVTNGKLIRLLVDDEPFDVRYGELTSHERVLDLKAGTLTREALWRSPAGKSVKVRSTRLVSFTQRSVAAIDYVVEAVDQEIRVVIQSELVANETMPTTTDDPRTAAAMEAPLIALEQDPFENGAVLVHRTRNSELVMGAGMVHDIVGPDSVEIETRVSQDWARTAVVCVLQPGETLRLTKFLAYGWSAERSQQAIRDQVSAAGFGARATGFDGLLAEQRAYLDEFWDAADVEVEGDDEIQQAVRFGLFHVLQAGARAEGRCIPAKGLTGPGYDGHTFWDTEGFVLPVLTYTLPGAAAHALRWRYSTLDLARARAETLGLKGAAFPWRTIRGQECSGYWPAGTAAMHNTADISAAIARYTAATGDETVELDGGLEVLVESARLWMSLGNFGVDGKWHIAGVTGPDEYTALVDDNIFTNLAGSHNLSEAADACDRHPSVAAGFAVTPEEVTSWRDAAHVVHLPYDEELKVHQQSAGFTRLPEWDFAASVGKYPLLLSAPYFDIYRRQVTKQADIGLATYWFGHHFSAADKARIVDYYEPRTVRDSSLSACIQAVMCAEVGHLELAHDYAFEAALIDLHDLHHNSRDGLHIASLAGSWIALVAGFGGMRDHGGMLAFDPALPLGLTRVCFSMRWHDLRLKVDITGTEVTYSLRDGVDASLAIRHAGKDVTVTVATPVTFKLETRTPLLPRPSQPAGCEPAPRAPTH